MRLLALLAVALSACTATNPSAPTPPGVTGPVDCRPTIAQMVPPQTVMDAMFGGMSPQPTATPTIEAWAATGNWIGNDALWVSLPHDGIFERRYHKLFSMALRNGPIRITGRRLEDGGAPDRIGSMNSENFGSSVNFAQAGCWEVTYDFAGEQLRFTLKVVD